MIEIGLAGLTAIALWWASTGAILYLDGLPARTFRWSMMIATVLAAAALWGVWMTRETATPTGALIGFACGVTLWGWQAMTFYMGYITGPRTTPCPPGLTGWRRFVAAAETNEIEILDESDGELVEQFDVAESVTVFEPANALGSPRSGSVVEGVSPVSLAERLSAPMSSVRRVTLRTMGQVRVDGAELSGASSVPFVVAASGRPMSAGEVADLTGYSKKTIANTYPVGGVVLDRADAHLTLASGVFTEHGWLVECGELAQRALAAGDTATAEWWTVQLALALEEVGGAPYESFPMNRVSGKDQTDPWSWVDDFPSSVSDRYAVGQAVAGAAMTLARLSAPVSSVPPSSAIELLVKIARLVPYAAQRSMDGSRLGSSGETLLGAAAIVAGSDQGLLGTVQQQARVLIDAGTIAPGDDLVGALGL